MATASILDSEAAFVRQAEDAGLDQPWIEALQQNGVATFGKLSFAITSPGTVATDEQITRFLNTLWNRSTKQNKEQATTKKNKRGISRNEAEGVRCGGGAAATIAELSAFKRLVFESQTLMIFSFKSTAKRDESAPKKMAAPEREARIARQREQLRGLDISGPLEPAHLLYDLCATMIERNEVAYINPNKCLSRQ